MNSPKTLTKYIVDSFFVDHSKWKFILPVILVLISFALHVNVLMAKTSIGYDESISYLVATCHAQEMAERPFSGQVEPVSSWKRLVTEVREPFCFAQITDSMAAYDIHPPLYFWLLHSWFVLFGVHFWSGPLLNSFLAIVIIFVLFQLAKKVLGHYGEALIVIFTFAMNPSVFLVSMETRQYELLLLWTLFFVWLLYIYTDGRQYITKGFYVAIFLIVFAGSLTHFLFLLPFTAGLVFVIYRLRRQKAELFYLVFAMLLAYLAAWLIFPYFFSSIGRVSGRVPEVTWENFWLRIQRVGISFASFYYVFVVVILLFIIALIYYWRRRSMNLVLAQVDWKGVSILFFPVWIAGAIIAQYLLFLTPTHAMGAPKYFSMVWPFLAFLPVFILRCFQYRRTVLLYFLLIPFVFSLFLPMQKRFFQISDPTEVLADYSVFVVDSIERGVLLQIIWAVPENASVLFLSQDNLLADDTWMTNLEPGTLYLSDLANPEIELNYQKILVRLDQAGFTQEPVPGIQTRSSKFEAVELNPP